VYPAAPEDGMLFSYPRYVIKGGEVVVEDGELRGLTEGREFIFRPEYDAQIEDYLRPLFQKVYTISFENYSVDLDRLRHADIVGVR
jgi:formylmethanofuran dehydrogenase subunit A